MGKGNSTVLAVLLAIASGFNSVSVHAAECPASIQQSHRGSQQYPENTIEAVTAAYGQGMASAEVDIQRLADGTWVLHHDPLIGRVVRVKGMLGKSAGSLSRANWRNGYTVDKLGHTSTAQPALFSDLLGLVGSNGGHLNIEIKGLYNCAQIAPMVQQVKAKLKPDQLMFSSIDQGNLSCVRQVWADVPVAWVVAPSAQTIKAQYSHYADQFSSLGRVLGFSIQALLLKAAQTYEAKNQQALSRNSIREFSGQFSPPAAVHVDMQHLQQYDWLAESINNQGLSLGVYNVAPGQTHALYKQIGYCPTWAIVDH